MSRTFDFESLGTRLKMAPKVVVPADFGIENLHCVFHGNVVFKLQGGEDMRANSLILSYHSSEFVRLFLELNQSVLEMDDFSKESVKSFLEALYRGEIQLDRNLFRDLNKMCHVFKVDWLSRRCGEYFEGLVEDIRPSTDYQTLLFLFEEARFSLKMTKSDKMLDMVVQKICGLENRTEKFVEPYMKNYIELGSCQLDLMLQITRSNPVSLLKIMEENLKVEGKLLDNASRYLLENLDICKCISDNEHIFEEFFDLLDSVTHSSDLDALFVNKLYRRSMKEFNISRNVSSFAVQSELNLTTSIPHIFCSFEHFRGLLPLECFEVLKESPSVLNLYMLIEGLLMLPYFSQEGLTPKMICEIEETRRLRSWSRISPDFFENSHPFFKTALASITKHSKDLISNDESVRRRGTVICRDKIERISFRLKDLFLTPLSFYFYLEHPKTNHSCDLPGHCGFLLKSRPEMKSGHPFKFTVDLCVDEEEYPIGLHIHPEFVKAEKIHLVPLCSTIDGSQYFHASITWNEHGISRAFSDENAFPWWEIGMSELDPFMDVSLTAFVTF